MGEIIIHESTILITVDKMPCSFRKKIPSIKVERDRDKLSVRIFSVLKNCRYEYNKHIPAMDVPDLEMHDTVDELTNPLEKPPACGLRPLSR